MNAFIHAANAALQRGMPVLAPLSVVTGLAVGAPLAAYSGAVFWVFAFMTFTSGLSLNPSELRSVFRYAAPLVCMLFLLHGVMPLAAWLGGLLCFSDPAVRLGLVLITLTPVGTSSLIWVAFYRGNVLLALAVITLDTLLIPFLFPVLLRLFTGAAVQLDMWAMWRSLCGMLLLPTLFAMSVNVFTNKRMRDAYVPVFSLLSKLGILFMLSVNGGIAAPYFREPSWHMLLVFAGVLALCCAGYALSYGVGRRFFSKHEDIMSFTLCGGLRNTASGAAVAMLHFSPATCFTLVFGMVLQQILGYNAGRIARQRLDRGA